MVRLSHFSSLRQIWTRFEGVPEQWCEIRVDCQDSGRYLQLRSALIGENFLVQKSVIFEPNIMLI